ncbi:MAG: ATP-dependent Clp protease proteolytic subunit [Candidatus Azobacteroides sp.]|nr:ATP-dependent Clp protease proteolytic subunit [Candidatus Azobacteroides sp.]
MSSWSEILNAVEEEGKPLKYLHELRGKTLQQISEKTGRNLIAYYSGWLTKPQAFDIDINDTDKNAFMQAVYKLDKNKGVDLVLHTPGGSIAATESIVDYLHSLFNGDIRAIIPQISMSAGTMIALACKEIMMGKQSNLGPIDAQMGGIACQAVLSEFKKAKEEVRNNPASLGLWQVIISKYHPTFLTACENAIAWSEELAKEWLGANDQISNDQIGTILNTFIEHNNSKSHNRHISIKKCKEVGLKIIDMEDDPDLQDLILSLHHCYMILFDKTNIVKAVENQIGGTYFRINPSPS